MLVYFLPTAEEPTYIAFVTNYGKARFPEEGVYNVKDEIGEHVINARPDLIGKTKEDVEIARGRIPEPPKKTNPDQHLLKKPILKTEEKPPEHPTTRGIKSVQKAIKKQKERKVNK